MPIDAPRNGKRQRTTDKHPYPQLDKVIRSKGITRIGGSRPALDLVAREWLKGRTSVGVARSSIYCHALDTLWVLGTSGGFHTCAIEMAVVRFIP